MLGVAASTTLICTADDHPSSFVAVSHRIRIRAAEMVENEVAGRWRLIGGSLAASWRGVEEAGGSSMRPINTTRIIDLRQAVRLDPGAARD